MPVDFLNDDVAARYGRFDGPPSTAELERVFFLDDEDRALIGRRRGTHNRLGYALQLTTCRYLGRFLPDPMEGVPLEVLDCLAGQLAIADPSCLKRYAQREPTHREHAGEIQRVFGLRDFAEAESELVGRLDVRAWNTGDGPTALFHEAVRWLRGNDVLLPGITTLTRLIARVRDEAGQRLWDTLAASVTAPQRATLDLLLEVPPDGRVSQLERWRTGPAAASGPALVRALHRVSEIGDLGSEMLDLAVAVPQRRMAELARYGMAADSAQLRKHPVSRRTAILLATVQRLQTKSVDDALDCWTC